MLLIDALAAGNVIMLVTTPDEENKSLCRLDFITSEEGQINIVRRSIVDKLNASNMQFNVSSLEVNGDKELRTIVLDPVNTRPLDYDKIATTAISKMLMETKGVLAFTSAYTHITDVNADQNIALFAKITKNQFVVDEKAVTLVYESALNDGEGSFSFKITKLTKSGDFEVLGKNYEHYGEVKLNRSEEFYIKKSMVEGKTSNAINNAVGVKKNTNVSDEDETETAGKRVETKPVTKNDLKNLVGNNKAVTAGASIFALAAIGVVANNSLQSKGLKGNAEVVRGPSLSEDKVKVGGELLTRSEAEELYNSF